MLIFLILKDCVDLSISLLCYEKHFDLLYKAHIIEVGKLLQKYNLPRLYYEETENVNQLIISEKIKSVIKNLSENKSPGPRRPR